ncbi:MFS transporter, partial [Staphylococcus epidermidis]
MTATFIIIYIVVALILIGFINFFLIKRKRKNKDKRVEQRSTIDSKRESNQSKFKASDLEQTTKSNTDPTQSNDIEDEKRKNHFDSEIDNASQSINTDSKEDRNALSHKNQEEDDASNDVLNPIDPNSTEGRVNERIKNQESNFIFGKGITRGKILAAMLFGMFIAILNQTLLNVALPKINTEFNISASTGQWLMTGFMLVNGILIPISAFLFNKYSYRKLFIIGLTLFTLGSLVCAISFNFPIMMSGRVLQAIGAGILMPLGSNVIVTIFPPEKRGVAMGTMGIAMILAPAIGPTLSGYIVQNYDWNVMFYGMFFIGIIAIEIGLFWFKLYQSTTNPKADIPGIIYSTIGFGSLLYGFSEAGNKGWGSTEIVTMFIV